MGDRLIRMANDVGRLQKGNTKLRHWRAVFRISRKQFFTRQPVIFGIVHQLLCCLCSIRIYDNKLGFNRDRGSLVGHHNGMLKIQPGHAGNEVVFATIQTQLPRNFSVDGFARGFILQPFGH